MWLERISLGFKGLGFRQPRSRLHMLSVRLVHPAVIACQA